MSIEQDLKDKSLWENGFQTRDGRPVRIVANEPECRRAVLGILNGHWESWFASGEASDYTHSLDLIRRPVKRKGWMGIANHSDPRYVAQVVTTDIYDTKATAEAQVKSRCWIGPISYVEVEYEVPQ